MSKKYEGFMRIGDSSPVLFMVNDQCRRCKHKYAYSASCDAFPDFMEGGIPNDLYTGKVLHDKPYPGDHGILFEEKEKPSQNPGKV